MSHPEQALVEGAASALSIISECHHFPSESVIHKHGPSLSDEILAVYSLNLNNVHSPGLFLVAYLH